MPSSNSLWTAHSQTRYRPVILVLTALAAGCTIYYLQKSIWNEPVPVKSQIPLHRSNAHRRRRTTQSNEYDENNEHEDEARQRDEEAGTDQVLGNNSGVNADSLVPNEGDTVTDAESEHSWRGNDDKENLKEGQSLLNLLYRIAEEQARKDGYIHRGVTCNGCSDRPIKGIRYRCTNCADYDLCEQCEALQIHPKTHIFYKLRIPAPFLGSPRPPQQVSYPGKPHTVTANLTKASIVSFTKTTGYSTPEIEALWEQFRCLAGTDWPDDQDHYRLAIDRPTFDKCFIPNTSQRLPTPNLIFDRMFSFYDTNNDDVIGFSEFIHGLASLKKNKDEERWRRVFKGYDIDNDGFVNRKDFLRMFRAYYAHIKELSYDVLADMEDINDYEPRDLVLGGQPISSVFGGPIPSGERSRDGEGKSPDAFGDAVIVDKLGAIHEKADEAVDVADILAENAEYGEEGIVSDWSLYNSDEIRELYEYPWPVYPTDVAIVERALGRPVSAGFPRSMMDVGEQYLVRRSIHGNHARKHQLRQTARRRALVSRQRKREFYPEEIEIDTTSSQSKAASFFVLTGEDVAFHNAFNRLPEKSKHEQLLQAVAHRIEERDWPLFECTSLELAAEVLAMIKESWSIVAITHVLSGYARVLTDVEEFVHSIAQYVKTTADELGPEATSEKLDPDLTLENPPLDSSPSSRRRSRSSSKVRFQEDLEDSPASRSRATSISSRSIPINERWGNFSISEPEQDVGREVLYHVTQEALNELLDPVFMLREDLTIAARAMKQQRERYRLEMAATNFRGQVEGCLRRYLHNSRIYSSVTPFREAMEGLWYVAPQSGEPESRGPEDGEQNKKGLDELFRESGYASAGPQPRQFAPEEPDSVGLGPANASKLKGFDSTNSGLENPNPSNSSKADTLDPTMPQNRPNNSSEQPLPNYSPNKTGEKQRQDPVPDTSTLQYYAALDLIEAEDRERGGPGRLDLEEFMEVIKGEKGEGLKFLGAWVACAAF